MRGRVRNNCFSLRVGVAQKATFARDAARCVARAYAFRLKLTKKNAHACPTRFGNRKRQCRDHVNRFGNKIFKNIAH